MNLHTNTFSDIDKLIKHVDNFKSEPSFSEEVSRRQNKTVKPFLNDSELLKNFAYLIAYSQNAKSDKVAELIISGNFDKAFADFQIDQVAAMNPCDIADKYWNSISSILKQAKLFHIVSLARKLKRIGTLSATLIDNDIPKQIVNDKDIEIFWTEFDKLLKVLKKNKIPFFQSTTSLLHFLLDNGYDCIKPDLVVMKVAKKLKIVEDEKGDNNLRTTVKTIQRYSVDRKVRPTIVDFYFLIDEGQLGAKKFVNADFYRSVRGERS